MGGLPINIGDKIEISLRANDRIKKAFSSKVENIESSNIIVMLCPIALGRIVVLPTTDSYLLTFTTKAQGVLSCDAKVINHFKTDNIYLTRVELVSEFKKIQRRGYFRFECLIPFEYRKIETSDDDEFTRLVTKFEEKKGTIIDISGGGLKLVLEEYLELNSEMEIFATLDEESFIAEGIILRRKTRNVPGHHFMYEYSLKFTGIDRASREMIIHYIFAKQRKMHRN